MTGSRASSLRRTIGRVLVGGLALLILVIGARLLVVRSFDSGPLPPRLAQISDLPVTLSNGRRSTLGSLLKPGLPTIISVWASWCGPCRKEAPVLSAIRARHGADRLNFLYLNGREPGGTQADLSAFVEGNGLRRGDYAVLDNSALPKLTNDTVNLIPRTYVFDKAGAPIAMIVGYKPLALARVEGLLK